MKNKQITGKQYGSRSSANRAIRNFIIRNFPLIKRGKHFWVNKIDNGCFEIDSNKD